MRPDTVDGGGRKGAEEDRKIAVLLPIKMGDTATS